MSKASASSSLIRPYAMRLLSDVRLENKPLMRSANASLALSPKQDEMANHAIAKATPIPRIIHSGNSDEDAAESSARVANMLRNNSDGMAPMVLKKCWERSVEIILSQCTFGTADARPARFFLSESLPHCTFFPRYHLAEVSRYLRRQSTWVRQSRGNTQVWHQAARVEASFLQICHFSQHRLSTMPSLALPLEQLQQYA